MYKKSAEIWTKKGKLSDVADAYNNMAAVHAALGNTQEAMGLFQQSHDIRVQETPNPQPEPPKYLNPEP